ncbi:MAG TPA: glycosyltransferase [Opitutaceae bacterium]|nr:glycosyltransferase [Opitutaceae bacterium]
MKILQVISSLNPAGGGVAACLQSLTPELVALGHTSEVATLDRPDEPFLAAFPGPVHALGPARLGYQYSPKIVPWLRQEAKGFDVVVVHGLWQYHGFAVHRALGRAGDPPYFIFSHGMLDPWFKREYPLKHIKKLFYWWPAERRVLRDALAVLFTCEEERVLARQSFAGYRCREQVVAFGAVGVDGDAARQREAFYAQVPAVRGKPFWLFLGRIHVKKGVDLLIDAYGGLAAEAARTGRSLPALVIAGPCADAEYLRQLQERAVARCPAGSVSWPGMIRGDTKWGALRAAEVFVLPSHQENFGIAVAEALSCGTPVLISDKVNIWREIKADAAGLVENDDLAGTAKLLSGWSAMDEPARERMRAAAAKSFAQRYAIQATALNLAKILADGLAANSRSAP